MKKLRRIIRNMGITRGDLKIRLDRINTLIRAHSVNVIERLLGSRAPDNLKDIPIIINSYNRLESLKEQIDWLVASGCNNIIILDNHSTYPPLKEYLESIPHRVIHLGGNIGPTSLWDTDFYQELCTNYYVYTDPDIIGSEECPSDFIEYFYSILKKYPSVEKVGFGLKLDDIPDHYDKKLQVTDWEQRFWNKPLGNGLFKGTIDTTFALYRPYAKGCSECKSLRSGAPYIARHMPWYSNSMEPTREDIYYQNSIKTGTSHWMGTEHYPMGVNPTPEDSR